MNIHEWLGEEIPPETIQQAVEWIAALDDKEGTAISENERLEFYAWLEEDAIHQQAFAELSEIWARTSCLKSLKAAIKEFEVIQFPLQRKRDDFDRWSNQPLITDSAMYSRSFSPSWLYEVTLVIIGVGFLIPFFL